MTIVKEDGRATPGRPLPGTATRAIREHDPVLNRVQGQVMAFDLETRGSDVQWHDAPGTHVKLGSFVVNGGPAQLTVGGPSLRFGPDHTLLDLLLVAGTLSGHGIMNYDLIVLHHQYPDLFPTPWELVRTRNLWDTQLVESLLDPPEARWKEGEAQRYYKLEEVAKRRGFPAGKTLDLANWAKRHGGFEFIPWEDERQNIDLLEYARQDSRLVWRLLRDQVARLNAPKYVYVDEKDHGITRRVPKHMPRVDMEYVEREHFVAAIAAQIQLNGFRVDTALLEERVRQGEEKKARILEELRTRYGLPTMTADGKKEAKSPQSTKAGKEAILAAFVDAGLDPGSFPRKEKSKQPDLSKDTMAKIIEHSDNERAIELAETIMGLNGIRTIYGQVQDSLVGDRVHPNISFRQASGRWSFTKPGLTVIGKRQGRVVEREVFIAEEGHVILTADMAQVDARAVAAMCQDEKYLELFAEGRDVWTEMATLFGITRDEVKVIGHGANYGMGINGTKRHNPGIPMDAIVAFHRGREEQFPDLMAWQHEVRAQAQAEGDLALLDNGWGRKLRVNPERAYTQAPALSGQSAARDIMMEGLLNLCREHSEALPWLRAVVHDEVVLSVPEDIAHDVAYEVNKAMTFPWAPPGKERQVQIKAEATVGGRTWASAYGK